MPVLMHVSGFWITSNVVDIPLLLNVTEKPRLTILCVENIDQIYFEFPQLRWQKECDSWVSL